jgi:hypothetical protein
MNECPLFCQSTDNVVSVEFETTIPSATSIMSTELIALANATPHYQLRYALQTLPNYLKVKETRLFRDTLACKTLWILEFIFLFFWQLTKPCSHPKENAHEPISTARR